MEPKTELVKCISDEGSGSGDKGGENEGEAGSAGDGCMVLHQDLLADPGFIDCKLRL